MCVSQSFREVDVEIFSQSDALATEHSWTCASWCSVPPTSSSSIIASPTPTDRRRSMASDCSAGKTCGHFHCSALVVRGSP